MTDSSLPIVIEGELDLTAEIPRVPLLPPVPPPARSDDDVVVGAVDWAGLSWLIGLMLAVALVLGYPLGQLLVSWSHR